MYDYASEVFSVGLEGFAQVDIDRINALASDGWEPTHMTPVHNGFAALVLFRREGGRPRKTTKPVPKKAVARTTAQPTKKAAARPVKKATRPVRPVKKATRAAAPRRGRS